MALGADQTENIIAERGRGEGRKVLRSFVEHAQVGMAAQHRRRHILGGHFRDPQIDFRITAPAFGTARRQQPGDRRRHGGDAHAPPPAQGGAAGVFQHIVQVVQQAADPGRQIAAGLRRANVAGVAVEQGQAQLGLQMAHTGADGGLGHAQVLGGAGEAAVAGDGGQDLQLAERKIHK